MGESRVRLSPPERRELESRVRSRALRAEDVRRARVDAHAREGGIVFGDPPSLACNANYISCWKARFLAERLSGLYARHAGRAIEKRTPKLEARILDWTRRGPTDGSTHWSSRKLAEHLGINHMMVARVWKRAGLKPHRLDRYMLSGRSQLRDQGGRHHRPLRESAPACRRVQRRRETAIQALDRLDPVLPLSPGRAERHGFEYYRHGTLSLYAALNTRSGEVLA